MRTRVLRCAGLTTAALGVLWACGFDDAFREYLNAHFWLPFAKGPAAFEKPGVKRISAPYAGMRAVKGHTPLEQLRAAYQKIAQPSEATLDPVPQRRLLDAARAVPSQTREQREEIDLIDAKIDMRAGESGTPELLRSAKTKFEAFLKAAKNDAFRSEARGWLARTLYLLEDQTTAGKMYLDELNRSGSNLSRETVVNSLRMNYGYDGGPEFRAHLEDYFDTPEHAAFAIQLATNPRWNRHSTRYVARDSAPDTSARIHSLLGKHRGLFNSNEGAEVLAVLAMRTELRMGNPAAARKIAEAVPSDARIQRDPDFLWMLASSHFLSHEYAQAEKPLLELFRSRPDTDSRKSAAAYGLCGVYRKTGKVIEQIRYALWLRSTDAAQQRWLLNGSDIDDFTVYWASSGWDLGMLLDSEAPIDALREFVEQNPRVPDVRLVQYALAVRLARENRYDESARIYSAIHAVRRAPRMRQLAALYREAERSDLTQDQRAEARYKLAQFLSENSNRIYFNDTLWSGFQRYAIERDTDDARLTRVERDTQMARQRKLLDDQEERWRAYLILRGVVEESGHSATGKRAALLALRCLRGIGTERFGREEDVHQAVATLSRQRAGAD